MSLFLVSLRSKPRGCDRGLTRAETRKKSTGQQRSAFHSTHHYHYHLHLFVAHPDKMQSCSRLSSPGCAIKVGGHHFCHLSFKTWGPSVTVCCIHTHTSHRSQELDVDCSNAAGHWWPQHTAAAGPLLLLPLPSASASGIQLHLSSSRQQALTKHSSSSNSNWPMSSGTHTTASSQCASVRALWSSVLGLQVCERMLCGEGGSGRTRIPIS